MREMTRDEKSWLEAFEKMENFNDKRGLTELGVIISNKIKKQMNRQRYARKTQIVTGKKGCVSLTKLEQKNDGEEIVSSNTKLEYVNCPVSHTWTG